MSKSKSVLLPKRDRNSKKVFTPKPASSNDNSVHSGSAKTACTHVNTTTENQQDRSRNPSNSSKKPENCTRKPRTCSGVSNVNSTTFSSTMYTDLQYLSINACANLLHGRNYPRQKSLLRDVGREKAAELRESIAVFGILHPVVFWRGYVLDGVARLVAIAGDLGQLIPVLDASHLDANQADLLRLSLNYGRRQMAQKERGQAKKSMKSLLEQVGPIAEKASGSHSPKGEKATDPIHPAPTLPVAEQAGNAHEQDVEQEASLSLQEADGNVLAEYDAETHRLTVFNCEEEPRRPVLLVNSMAAPGYDFINRSMVVASSLLSKWRAKIWGVDPE